MAQELRAHADLVWQGFGSLLQVRGLIQAAPPVPGLPALTVHTHPTHLKFIFKILSF